MGNKIDYDLYIVGVFRALNPDITQALPEMIMITTMFITLSSCEEG